MKSINPKDGSLLETYQETPENALEVILAQAVDAQSAWALESIESRAEALGRIAEMLDRDREAFSLLMTQEMGKPIMQARAEIEKCALTARYYQTEGPNFLVPEHRSLGVRHAELARAPLGVILGIMPWNFPQWQVLRFALPTLLSGNAIVLKHASNVSGSALLLEKKLHEAGLPRGLFQVVLVPGNQVSPLIRDRRIAGVSLTGSTPAGRAVAEVAGQSLKKCVLELGGSDAYLVLEDADIALAARVSAQGRLTNSGQSCVAAKRFIVMDSVYDAFVEALREEMRSYKMEDPELSFSRLGPLARVDLRDELHDQVERSVHEGARRVLGGIRPDGKGAYYPASILADVTPEMTAFREELFGPVASVTRVQDETHAVLLSNASAFGLGGGIFTRDLERALQIARHSLHTGTIAINDHVKSDPRVPFGGVKDSGYGRELSEWGLYEFTNLKTITFPATR